MVRFGDDWRVCDKIHHRSFTRSSAISVFRYILLVGVGRYIGRSGRHMTADYHTKIWVIKQ